MNFLDIEGENYETDFLSIVRMFKDITETINTDNWEGEKLTHTFTTLGNETIVHTMGRVPIKVVPLNYEDVLGNYIFISATSEEVTLKSSAIGLTLTFYLE